MEDDLSSFHREDDALDRSEFPSSGKWKMRKPFDGP